jgi:hypothetical protein
VVPAQPHRVRLHPEHPYSNSGKLSCELQPLGSQFLKTFYGVLLQVFGMRSLSQTSSIHV